MTSIDPAAAGAGQGVLAETRPMPPLALPVDGQARDAVKVLLSCPQLLSREKVEQHHRPVVRRGSQQPRLEAQGPTDKHLPRVPARQPDTYQGSTRIIGGLQRKGETRQTDQSGRMRRPESSALCVCIARWRKAGEIRRVGSEDWPTVRTRPHWDADQCTPRESGPRVGSRGSMSTLSKGQGKPRSPGP